MKIIDAKGSLHDRQLLHVLSLYKYMPTEEKMLLLADEYEADESISVFTCVEEDVAVGVIVVRVATEGSFEMLGIAVEADFREKGIGSMLISYVIEHFPVGQICAETDDDAVGFYRKYGFDIKSLGEKYPGVVRYLCTYKLS